MRLLPTPRQLGFPAKYDGGWRPKQEEALHLLLSSQKRTSVLSMPTGSGKSAVVVAYALITKRPTAIVTDSRQLQDQYLDDFKGVGMVDLRGRRNYSCPLKNDYTCEEGRVARCPYHGQIACPLSQAEFRAGTSSLVITNYDKWTSARKFGTGLSHIQQVVFDEGHKAPSALERAMQVTLSANEVERVLGIDFPSGVEELVNWKLWAMSARREAEERMLAAKALLGANPSPSQVRLYTHLRNLCRRLNTIATSNPNNWVVDQTERGFVFDVVQAGRYAESTLLLKVPRIVVVSATIRPKSLFLIGIAQKDFDYKEFDSDFDPKRAPIYYIPTMRVDKNAHDLSPLWTTMDRIAARRRDRKGLVQTISYLRQGAATAFSQFANAMILNPKGEPSTETLSLFRASDPGAILVSPSFAEGVDFSGRDCEWQFVCKIPFPDSRSKVIRARQEADPEYGPYHAMNKLVQIFGRGMRYAKDQCENFIGDMHMDWFYPKYRHLAPKSFHGFYRQVTTLPAPPPKL